MFYLKYKANAVIMRGVGCLGLGITFSIQSLSRCRAAFPSCWGLSGPTLREWWSCLRWALFPQGAGNTGEKMKSKKNRAFLRSIPLGSEIWAMQRLLRWDSGFKQVKLLNGLKQSRLLCSPTDLNILLEIFVYAFPSCAFKLDTFWDGIYQWN